MRHASESKWKEVFDECAKIARMSFNFKSKEEPFDYCSNLAQRMHKYAVRACLTFFFFFTPRSLTLNTGQRFRRRNAREK